MAVNQNILNKNEIENRIFTIRGYQVMLDSHLAELYGVETKQLNRAVKRNKERFPDEFMFKLNDSEWESLKVQIKTLETDDMQYLRYQIGTSNTKHGGRRYSPYYFYQKHNQTNDVGC